MQQYIDIPNPFDAYGCNQIDLVSRRQEPRAPASASPSGTSLKIGNSHMATLKTVAHPTTMMMLMRMRITMMMMMIIMMMM